MYLENIDNEKTIVRVGRTSEVGIKIIKNKKDFDIEVTTRKHFDGFNFSDESVTYPLIEGVAAIYGLHTDGLLIPVNVVMNLQNDVIDHLINNVLTVK